MMDMVKQIILITDGCSNSGTSPIVAAAHAYVEGIIVNVIGILDQGDLGQKGALEVGEIARAGGGLSKLVHASQISQTVQMITRQTVVCTIRQTVQEELKKIMISKQMSVSNSDPIEVLPPEQRAQVIEVMDEMVDSVPLRMSLLLDTSASMKSKWSAVIDAIHDLGLSLQARQGANDISVYRFPSTSSMNSACDRLLNSTNQLAKMGELFYNIEMKGTTPTGPAILEVVQYMSQAYNGTNKDKLHDQQSHMRDGLLRDYII
jgi:Ca-activated chloride channel family protein